MGDKTQINELMNSYFSEGCAELVLLVAEIVTGIEELLDALVPVNEHLLSKMPDLAINSAARLAPRGSIKTIAFNPC